MRRWPTHGVAGFAASAWFGSGSPPCRWYACSNGWHAEASAWPVPAWGCMAPCSCWSPSRSHEHPSSAEAALRISTMATVLMPARAPLPSGELDQMAGMEGTRRGGQAAQRVLCSLSTTLSDSGSSQSELGLHSVGPFEQLFAAPRNTATGATTGNQRWPSPKPNSCFDRLQVELIIRCDAVELPR